MNTEKIGLYKDIYDIVYRVISSTPLDDNINNVWELCTPRLEGDYTGSRIICDSNIIMANNLVKAKLLANTISFNSILIGLQQQQLIRKQPEILRQTFKVV